jgi:predicted Fe-Mo cluster-binding NifX family protein
MKVAVAVLNDAICPRLDCARRLVVLDIDSSTERSRRTLDIGDWPAIGRAGRLADLGVDVLVCGALSRFDEAGLEASGIYVVRGVAGPVESVVAAVHAGTLEPHEDYWQGMPSRVGLRKKVGDSSANASRMVGDG